MLSNGRWTNKYMHWICHCLFNLSKFEQLNLSYFNCVASLIKKEFLGLLTLLSISKHIIIKCIMEISK